VGVRDEWGLVWAMMWRVYLMSPMEWCFILVGYGVSTLSVYSTIRGGIVYVHGRVNDEIASETES